MAEPRGVLQQVGSIPADRWPGLVGPAGDMVILKLQEYPDMEPEFYVVSNVELTAYLKASGKELGHLDNLDFKNLKSFQRVQVQGGMLTGAGISVRLSPGTEEQLATGTTRAPQRAEDQFETIWQRLAEQKASKLEREAEYDRFLGEFSIPERTEDWARLRWLLEQSFEEGTLPQEDFGYIKDWMSQRKLWVEPVGPEMGPGVGAEGEGGIPSIEPVEGMPATAGPDMGGLPITGAPPTATGAPAAPTGGKLPSEYTMEELVAMGSEGSRIFKELIAGLDPSQKVALYDSNPEIFDILVRSPVELGDLYPAGFPSPSELQKMSMAEAESLLRELRTSDPDAFNVVKGAITEEGWITSQMGTWFPQEVAGLPLRGRDPVDRMLDTVTQGWPKPVRDVLRTILGGGMVGAEFEGYLEQQWWNYQKAWEDATGEPISEEDYVPTLNSWLSSVQIPRQLMDEAWQVWADRDPQWSVSSPIVKQVSMATGRPQHEIYAEIYQQALQASPQYQAQLTEARRMAMEQISPVSGEAPSLESVMATLPEVDLSAQQLGLAVSNWSRQAYDLLPEESRIPRELLPPTFFSPQANVAAEALGQRAPPGISPQQAAQTQAEKEFQALIGQGFPEDIQERMYLEQFFPQIYQEYEAQSQQAVPFTEEQLAQQERASIGTITQGGKKKYVSQDEYKRLQALYKSFQSVPNPWVSAELLGQVYQAGTPLPQGWQTPDIKFGGLSMQAIPPSYTTQPFGQYLKGLGGKDYLSKLLPEKAKPPRAPKPRTVFR